MMGLLGSSCVYAQEKLKNSVHGADSQFNKASNVFGINIVQDVPTLGVIIGNVINTIFGFLGVGLVLVIVYSGFMYMTSQGEPEKAKKARRTLVNAIIGAAIVILAWSISYGVLALITQEVIKKS